MIKNFLRSIKHFLNNFYDIHIQAKEIETINPEKTVFIMLAANYSNLGDVAITYAQKKFLEEIFPDKKVIEIPVEDTCKVFKSMKKKINENTIITLIGGGNTGNKYELIERYRRFIVRNFSKNRIVSFPQTCDFSDDSFGLYSLKRSIVSYKKNKALTLVAREDVSYKFYQKNFANKVILTPDIVLSLNFEDDIPRDGVCVLFRDDKEKKLTMENEHQLLQYLKENFSELSINDTCIQNFKPSKKYEQLFNLLDDIRSKKLVLTDRLHGMIFCYITKTSCIVFPNNNHKVIRTYENWLKKCNYLKLVQKFDFEEIKNYINELYNLKDKKQNDNLIDNYQSLKDVLKKD